jgi:hypothetical protein
MNPLMSPWFSFVDVPLRGLCAAVAQEGGNFFEAEIIHQLLSQRGLISLGKFARRAVCRRKWNDLLLMLSRSQMRLNCIESAACRAGSAIIDRCSRIYRVCSC